MGDQVELKGSMQPSSASDEYAADIAASVVASMHGMGVVGLPRNYEIFYEVLTGSNRELSDAFAALGAKPKQADLDQIARTFFPQSERQSIVENAQAEVAGRAEEIMSLLGRERNSLEKFGVILDKTSTGLATQGVASRDLMRKVVGIMATATEATLEQARQISASMQEKTAELAEVKSKLEEYKKLAETDPLTRLWNRRAFDRRLAKIFDTPRNVMFGALILADIDDFKAFNDRYGHPAGDKILQIVARIMRATAGANSFVARTGGEEFALVVEGLTEDATERLADSVRDSIAKAEFVVGPSTGAVAPITVSLGMCMASEAQDPEDLYVKTDRALYASKVGGRNRVTRHSRLRAGQFSKNWLLYRSD